VNQSGGDKVWLISGCSRGLGRVLAETVLARGDRLIATAREGAALAGLQQLAPQRVLALALDVNREEQVHQVVRAAIAGFGRIDVLVNNAGYGLAGAVEEISDAEARAQFDTNVFGALSLTRAVLPQMRAQGSGHILQISSVAGFAAAAGLGLYNASKFALEGFSEALAQEVAGFGIRLTMVEPGPFRTDWAGPSLATPRQRLAAYADTAHKTIATLNGYSGKQPGDPAKAAAAMIRVVEAEQPPLRLPLGEFALNRIRGKLKAMNQELASWETVSLDTAFPPGS
jgi:NAD(P)-dependent dehydrogenase (short-subunit alcohol dehydrogenase family)